ncbi:MAG TPA: YtxH domain-containing protein [Alloiococcus sp.]|nr:YtxH domain-containing protein [Alloiococcus sp.]
MNKITMSIGLAVGGATGFALAYLFAPQSGREFEEKSRVQKLKTKRQVLLKADDMINKLNYHIGREVSKEEARQINDMRERVQNQYAAPKEHLYHDPLTEEEQMVISEAELEI